MRGFPHSQNKHYKINASMNVLTSFFESQPVWLLWRKSKQNQHPAWDGQADRCTGKSLRSKQAGKKLD